MDKTARTGHPRKDIRDWTVSTGQPDRQPKQVSLEMTEMTGQPGHDSGVRRAGANVAWQGSWNRKTARTGQPDRTDESGQDVLDRTSGTGQLGQDSRDTSDWTSRPIGNLARTARTRQCLENVLQKSLKTKISVSVFLKMFVIPTISRKLLIITKMCRKTKFREHFQENIKNTNIFRKTKIFVERNFADFR